MVKQTIPFTMSNDKTDCKKICMRIFKICKELPQTIVCISTIYGSLISLNEMNALN